MNNMVGQLVFTGLSGTTLTEEEKEFIEKENIGGVILFSKNYESPAQLAELVNSIQALRSEYPLFICTDHEGGRVVRFKKHFTQFPSMLDMAKTDSPKAVFQMSQIMAEELSACGINLNLSPVCDILNNDKNQVIGDRAFGKDADTVSKFISSVIRGFQTNDVLACAKHFPGHGCTVKDSHYDLPVVKKTLEELKDEELNPFIKAVKSRVEFVMMAHMIVECLDTELPCTLSPKAYEYLRKELKFTKLIITDDMQMQAITDHYGVEDAAIRAIAAGADVIEYRDFDQAKIALEGLKKAMKVKDLKNEVVKDRFDRIMQTKKTYFKEYKPIYIPDIAKVIGIKTSEQFVTDIKKKIELTN